MADRDMQVILNSGDITNINIGGTASENAVVKTSALNATNLRVSDLENPSTEAPEFNGISTATSQQPVGTNNPLQIEFGVAQTGTNASLAADGKITFHTAGEYHIIFSAQFGRIGSVSQSLLFGRFLLNGSQLGNTITAELDDGDVLLPFSYFNKIPIAANDTLTFEMYRDSTGNDSGGLFSKQPTLGGWSLAPTASMIITKHI